MIAEQMAERAVHLREQARDAQHGRPGFALAADFARQQQRKQAVLLEQADLLRGFPAEVVAGDGVFGEALAQQDRAGDEWVAGVRLEQRRCRFGLRMKIGDVGGHDVQRV